MVLTSLTAWVLIQSPPLVSQQRLLLKAHGAGDPLPLPCALQWISSSWPMSCTVLPGLVLVPIWISRLAPVLTWDWFALSLLGPVVLPGPQAAIYAIPITPSASPQSMKYIPSICLIHPQAHSPCPCERGGKP